jgi:cytochrome b6-f complex iron-sulfur subunit
MKTKTETRREFCTQACQAASLLALGSVLPGCGSTGGPTSSDEMDGMGGTGGMGGVGQLSTVSATEANGSISLAIDASSPLSAVGSAALVNTQSRTLLVARTAQDAFTALTAICTHQVCTITGYTSQTYVCPCHGSRFDTSGRVIAGPAPRGLRQYSTQFANGELTVSL